MSRTARGPARRECRRSGIVAACGASTREQSSAPSAESAVAPATEPTTREPRVGFPPGVYGLSGDGIWRLDGRERHRWIPRRQNDGYGFEPHLALGADGALWTASSGAHAATIEHFVPPSIVPRITIIPDNLPDRGLDTVVLELIPHGNSAVCAQQGPVSIIADGTVEHVWTRDDIVRATGLPPGHDQTPMVITSAALAIARTAGAGDPDTVMRARGR